MDTKQDKVWIQMVGRSSSRRRQKTSYGVVLLYNVKDPSVKISLVIDIIRDSIDIGL